MSYNNKSNLLIENILYENDLLNEINLRSIKELIRKIPRFTESTLNKIKGKIDPSKFKKILKFLISNKRIITSITMLGMSLVIGCASNPVENIVGGSYDTNTKQYKINLSDENPINFEKEENDSRILAKFDFFLQASVINNVRYVTSNDYLHRLNIDKATLFDTLLEYKTAVAQEKDWYEYKINDKTIIYFYYTPSRNYQEFVKFVKEEAQKFVLRKTGDRVQAKEAKRKINKCMQSDVVTEAFGFACSTNPVLGGDHDHNHDDSYTRGSEIAQHALSKTSVEKPDNKNNDYAIAVINLNNQSHKELYSLINDFWFHVIVHELGHARDHISKREIRLHKNIFKNIRERNNRENIKFTELIKLSECGEDLKDKKKLMTLVAKLISIGHMSYNKKNKTFSLNVNKYRYQVRIEEFKEFSRNVSNILKDTGNKYSNDDIKGFLYMGLSIWKKNKPEAKKNELMKKAGIPKDLIGHPAWAQILEGLKLINQKHVKNVIEKYAKGIVKENKLKNNMLIENIANKVYLKLLNEFHDIEQDIALKLKKKEANSERWSIYNDLYDVLKEEGYDIIGSGHSRVVFSKSDVPFVVKLASYPDSGISANKSEILLSNKESYSNQVSSMLPELYSYSEDKEPMWIICEKVTPIEKASIETLVKAFPTLYYFAKQETLSDGTVIDRDLQKNKLLSLINNVFYNIASKSHMNINIALSIIERACKIIYSEKYDLIKIKDTLPLIDIKRFIELTSYDDTMDLHLDNLGIRNERDINPNSFVILDFDPKAGIIFPKKNIRHIFDENPDHPSHPKHDAKLIRNINDPEIPY